MYRHGAGSKQLPQGAACISSHGNGAPDARALQTVSLDPRGPAATCQHAAAHHTLGICMLCRHLVDAEGMVGRVCHHHDLQCEAACCATHLRYALGSSSSLCAALHGCRAHEALGARLPQVSSCSRSNWLPQVLSQAVHAVTYLSCVPRRSQLVLQGSGDLSGIEEKIVRELERHPPIAFAEDECCCGWEIPETAPSAILSADASLGVKKTSGVTSI